MNTFNRIMGVAITFFISVIVFFMGVKVKAEGTPNSLFLVYLNGDKLGLIDNKQELLDLIDKEQSELKNKYEVDKVYPPSGLDIQSVLTYDNDVKSVQSIYDEIKDKEPFTISGYKVTIIPGDDVVRNEGEESTEERKTIVLNVLRKKDFEEGFYNTVAAFVGTDELERYKNNTQLEVVETGSTIKNVYWKEDIKIKKDYLSTEEYIYTNSSDISKYLLFGTLKDGPKYTVKDGDNIKSVATANNLNVDEFLVANPEFSNANVLLTAGQKVNTALISPLVNIVYEVQKIEDVEVPYETEYQDDDTSYQGTNETLQEGVNGEARVTEEIQYINGEIQGLYISNSRDLSPSVSKIVKRGTKSYASSDGPYVYYDKPLTNDSWQWPTISPYIITSHLSWRWGRMHEGIDISGCGYGSPIYSVADGVVSEAGYYSSNGNYVVVSHGNDYYTIYMHLAKYTVSVGQNVSKGQQVGTMGNSGRSTGTHLHLGVFKGYPYRGGTVLDPCNSIFKC